MKALIFSALLLLSAQAVGQPREVHGAGDAFTAEGISVVWGVLRGATEELTEVRLRIVADPSRYDRFEVVNVNPFNGDELRAGAAGKTAAAEVVAIPRARFSKFPRTELRFFAAQPARANADPVLSVYYLGVPDTTPEFDDAKALTRRLESDRK
jgi:hypothetical protein